MIREFLAAAGITKVIWIDDHFSAPNQDENAARILRFVETARLGGHQIAAIPQLATLDFGRPEAAREADLDALLETLNPAQMADIADQLGVLLGPGSDPGTGLTDLPPEDFNALELAFGDTLTKFSLIQWERDGLRTYGASGEDTLFLIDRNYRRERRGYDGLEIVETLISSSKAFCVVLTFTCVPENRNAERVAYAKLLKLKPYQFSVLSKQPHGGEPVLVRFARAIYEAYGQRLTGQVANAMEEVVRVKAAETSEVLSAESIYDVDKAVFENSFEEGVSECEVLHRIFRANEKADILRLMGTKRVQALIRAMRHFRRATEEIRSELGDTKTELPKFRQWRKDEVFVEGDLLNAVHSPVACGDLFEVTLENKSKKRYVLIAQPCDLMVRGKAEPGEVNKEGERNVATAIFAPVAPIPAGTLVNSRSPYRYFDVTGILGKGAAWRVDFSKTWQINLDIADLTVFNSDGIASLSKDQKLPDALFATGWEKKLKGAKNWFPPNAKHPPVLPIVGLGVGSAALKIKVGAGDVSFAFPLQRIGRFESEVGTAILAAWSIFQTRAAFDHDFARHGTAAAAEVDPDGDVDGAQSHVEIPAISAPEGLFQFLKRWMSRETMSLVRRFRRQ